MRVLPPATAGRQDGRAYLSILPPHLSRTTQARTLSDLGDGPAVTLFTQPLKPLGLPDIRLHSYAVDNGDGTLTMIGALAPTGEHLGRLPGGKPVSDIILPSSSPEHYLYGPAFSRAFPEARVWLLPGFLNGSGVPLPGRSLLFREARERGVLRELGGSDPRDSRDFPPGLSFATLDVPLFCESAIFIRSASAVVLSDLALKLDPADPEYADGGNRFGLAEAAGIWGEVGAITKIVLEKHPREARAWFERVDAFPFRNLLLSHGTAVVEDVGKEELRRAMGFLFRAE
jgi:hypothetical protein